MKRTGLAMFVAIAVLLPTEITWASFVMAVMVMAVVHMGISVARAPTLSSDS